MNSIVDQESGASSDRPILTPFNITLIYICVGILWILFSDAIVGWIAPDASQVVRFQAAKGIGYVLATGAMLHFLIRRFARALKTAEAEQMTAARERAEQTAFIGSVLDSMGDGVIMADADGGTVRLNPVAREQLGLNREFSNVAELLAHVELLDPERKTPCPVEDFPLTQALKGERAEPRVFYRRGVHRFDERWFRVGAEPVRDEAGLLQGAVVTLSDITAEQRAGAALRENRRMMATLLANLPGMAYRSQSGPGWPMEFVSEGCERLTGYAPGEFLAGRVKYEELIHPDDRARVRAETEMTDGHHEAFTLSYRIRTKSGDERWVREIGRVVEWDGSRAKAFEGFITDISEQRWAEEQLASREEHFRSLIENIQDVICVFAPDGTTQYVSPSIQRVAGYEPDEMVGRRGTEFIHPDDNTLASTLMTKAFDHPGEVHRFLYRFLCKDGRWIYAEGEGQVSLDQDGKPRMILAARDITERVESEERLERNERHFRSLIENALDIIAVVDRDGEVKYVSSSIERTLGYSAESLLGREWIKLVHEDDLDRIGGSLSGAREGESATEWARIRHQDGSWREIEAVGRQITSPEGEVQFIVNARDVTERTAREMELRRLAAALEQTDEAIVVTNPDGTIEYVNPAFERVTGYHRNEVIGQNPRILKSGQHDASFYRDMWNTLARGEVWRGRLRNKRKDGEIYEERTTISPVLGPDGRVSNYVAVKQDVTREARIEEHMREHQKLEAIGTLAGGIAHDFNNILSAVIGYTEIALQEVESDSQLHGDLEEVLRAGQRARDLIQQILAFSRQTEQEKQPLRLDLILKEALKMLKASLPSTIEVRQRFQPDCGSVLADASQMHQVIMNLCTNAFHAMRERGGVLTVELKTKTVTPEAVDGELAGLEPGPYVCLCVKDTGHGMDEHVIKHMFEPFFSTKAHEGTGLGLATVHGIVTSHGGTITVKSEVGRGAEFCIYLPRIDQESAPTDVRDARPIPLGQGEEVLLVDDEEALVRLGTQILERLGYNVTARTSSVEALEAFRAQPQKFHIVVTDQTMPKITGLALTEKIREIRPDIPVVIVTGFSEQITEARVRALNIAAVVMKPIISRDLAQAMQSALKGAAS